jgi:hypothetical protein
MPDAGIAGPGAAETTLAGLVRSCIGDSTAPEPLAVPGAAGSPWGTVFAGAPTDEWEVPPEKPAAGGLSPIVPLVMPAAVRSASAAPLADASGGGCGGRSAATRWRTPGAAARSELVEVADKGSPAMPATLGGGTSTGTGPGLEVAVAASGRARSRPLPPGGVSSEFTAYAPTSTPTMAATTKFNLVSTLRPAGVCTLDLAGLRSIPQRQSTTEPAHIKREYGQR